MFTTPQNPVEPSGQTETPAPIGDAVTPEPQVPQESDVVTRKYMDERLAEVEKTILSKAQSMTGKMESRILKKQEQMKSAGVQVTPQQAEAILAQEDKDAQGGIPAQVTSQQPLNSDPIKALAQTWMAQDGLANPHPADVEAYEIMARAGVHLSAEDPEVKEIKTGSMLEYLESMREVTKKIAERKAKSGVPNPAVVPGLVQGPPATGVPWKDMDATATLELALKEQKAKLIS